MKSRRRRSNILTVILGIFTGVVLIGVLYPVSLCPGYYSPAAQCMNQLKQLSLGQLMYAGDYDDRLPAASTWMDAIGRYSMREEFFHCPGIKNDGRSSYGYAMNRLLDRKTTEAFAAPDTVPLVFDSFLLFRNARSRPGGFPSPPRHRGNRIAYLDGHVGVQQRQARSVH